MLNDTNFRVNVSIMTAIFWNKVSCYLLSIHILQYKTFEIPNRMRKHLSHFSRLLRFCFFYNIAYI